MNINIMKAMLEQDLKLIKLVESTKTSNNNLLKRVVQLAVNSMVQLCTTSVYTHINSPIYRQYIIELMKHFSDKKNDEMCQFILFGVNK